VVLMLMPPRYGRARDAALADRPVMNGRMPRTVDWDDRRRRNDDP
jgi:hypothetical protein